MHAATHAGVWQRVYVSRIRTYHVATCIHAGPAHLAKRHPRMQTSLCVHAGCRRALAVQAGRRWARLPAGSLGLGMRPRQGGPRALAPRAQRPAAHRVELAGHPERPAQAHRRRARRGAGGRRDAAMLGARRAPGGWQLAVAAATPGQVPTRQATCERVRARAPHTRAHQQRPTSSSHHPLQRLGVHPSACRSRSRPSGPMWVCSGQRAPRAAAAEQAVQDGAGQRRAGGEAGGGGQACGRPCSSQLIKGAWPACLRGRRRTRLRSCAAAQASAIKPGGKWGQPPWPAQRSAPQPTREAYAQSRWLPHL
jgi:hypothetical protein